MIDPRREMLLSPRGIEDVRTRSGFETVAYVSNPVALWEEKRDAVSIIFRATAPWLWLARWIVKGQLGNTGNVGYLIRDAQGNEIEHVLPPTPEAQAL